MLLTFHLVNKEQKVQECDATTVEISDKAD